MALNIVASIQVEDNQKAYLGHVQPECPGARHEFFWIAYIGSKVRKTTPAPSVSDQSKAELEAIFSGLAKIWRDSTGGFSTTTRRFTHPTYKAILRLGPEVVPLILRELQQSPDWWFDALEFLTGENPTKPADQFAAAVEAWIAWGKSTKHIS